MEDTESTIFEYMYRDAGNYKSYGQVLLRGGCAASDWQCIETSCDSGMFFVAEQVSLPPLYEALYA